MTNIKKQVAQSATDLQNAWTFVRNVTGTALPNNSYKEWEHKSRHHQILSETDNLFSCRDNAWQLVQNIPTHQVADTNRVTYSGIEMDYPTARHLALTSYMAVTWSIYDRLANVCGRLSGNPDTSNNPKQNPKPVEYFLQEKYPHAGFGVILHVKNGYTWPLLVSYKVRNWLVHEGFDSYNTPMFLSNQISDGFTLHDAAVSYFQKECGYDQDSAGKINNCCIDGANEAWPSKDLLKILEQYHHEIDLMFCGLVKWSVDSYVGQIGAFTLRDQSFVASQSPSNLQPSP